jgi:hypothetical protein
MHVILEPETTKTKLARAPLSLQDHGKPKTPMFYVREFLKIKTTSTSDRALDVTEAKT